ncbi:MAG: dihydrofolate reductase family protein [Sneathiella sp.]
MRKKLITGHVMMATSLDGFVARKDHTLDWLTKQRVSNEEHGFEKFQESVDVIVMGSRSFKTVLGFGGWHYLKPTVILSNSMSTKDIPAELRDKIEISNLKPVKLMEMLQQRGCKRVYVDGGAVVQSFMRLGLIQDMKITLIPILIGEGIKLFGKLDGDIDLKVESVNHFKSGLITTHYTVL